VSSIVSIRATWSPPVEEIVQSSSRAAIEERPVELALELADRALDVAGPGANRARHPVEGA
jgi:hypothetical protein